jgi:putative endonuclease
MKTDSYVYILTNEYNKVFYIGVTSNLIKRIWEHKNKITEGFTSKYNLHKLVYYEATCDIGSAIFREKQLKRWHRQWKINLIKEFNPTFEDLYYKII